VTEPALDTCWARIFRFQRELETRDRMDQEGAASSPARRASTPETLPVLGRFRLQWQRGLEV